MPSRGWIRPALVFGCGLAGVGALAGLWLGEHRYAWLGVMVVAVTGAFAPTAYEAVAGRRRSRDELELIREPKRRAYAHGPASLLDPRTALIPFVGRQDELSDLIAWCESPSSGSLRLLTGPGGTGKSRLAVELSDRLTTIGWHCEHVADGAEGTSVSGVRRVTSKRVLLVLDYAETRTGLTTFLQDVARESGAFLRVLLIARSAGEWWDRLAAAAPGIRDILARAYSGKDLSPVVESAVPDADVVRNAIPAFATALGVRSPRHVDVTSLPRRARILDLHAAALVAVLRSRLSRQDTVQVSVDGVLVELLAHEDRFWQGAADRAGLLHGPMGLTVAVLRRIVAAANLLGAASEAEAVRLLERVPGAQASTKVAAWLRDLYPPAPDGPGGAGAMNWLGYLQPDRLAEYHVINQLSQSPELAEHCLSDLDDRQALRAITVLGRAAFESDAAKPFLQRVLPLLTRVLEGIAPDVDLLTALANAISWPPKALDQAQVVVLHRLLESLSEDGANVRRAKVLSQYGMALTYVGRHAEAVEPILAATAIFRKVSIRGGVWGCLTYLELVYEDLQRYADALRVHGEIIQINLAEARDDPSDENSKRLEESVRWAEHLLRSAVESGPSTEGIESAEAVLDIHRELPHSVGVHRTDLLKALGVHCRTLMDKHATAEVLPVALRVASLMRDQVAVPPEPDLGLARFLLDLSRLQQRLNLPADALATCDDAVSSWRVLASAGPEHGRSLALALQTSSLLLHRLGRSEEAVAPAEEAAALVRSTPGGGAQHRLLANISAHLVDLLVALKKPAEAVAFAEDAVAARRSIAETDDRGMGDLAYALRVLVRRYCDLRRHQDSLVPIREAVDLERRLAEHDADHRATLGHSLQQLVFVLGQLNMPAEALPYAEEAVSIRRQAAGHGDRDLAYSLKSLAWRYRELVRYGDASGPAQEALVIYRRLADADADTLYTYALAELLNNLSFVVANLGRPEEALADAEEAVAIYRTLAEADPDALHGLAHALRDLGFVLAELGRRTPAVARSAEAVAILRDFAHADPRRSDELAYALKTLGRRLHEAGQLRDALLVVEEASALYRQLTAVDPDDVAGFADCLQLLSTTLHALGEPAKALAPAEEAEALLRGQRGRLAGWER